MDHLLVGALQQTGVLGRHAHRGPLVIDCLHPRKEPRIEADRVGVGGELGAYLGVDLVEALGGVGAGQGVEHAAHSAEHLARCLERDDGVCEGRRRLVGDDRIDLAAVDRHGLPESGEVIALLDLGEVGGLEGQGAFGGKRPARGHSGLGARGRFGRLGLLALGGGGSGHRGFLRVHDRRHDKRGGGDGREDRGQNSSLHGQLLSMMEGLAAKSPSAPRRSAAVM